MRDRSFVGEPRIIEGMKSVGWLVVASLLVAPMGALAAFSNENSLLIGDRHAGMGAAAVAVDGDAAGAPFYNPALLADLEGSAFSAAVGIYKKFDVLYGAEEDFTKAPLRINQGFFRSLPASTSNVLRWDKLPDWTLAFSVVVPDYEQFKGDLRSDATNVSTLTFTDESLWVGGAMARKISADESLGLTLYYTARNYTKTVSDRSYPSGTKTQVYTQEKTIVENGIVPILGYRKTQTERFSWGVTLRLPAWKILGRATLFESLIEVDSNAVNPILLSSVNAPEKSARVVIPGKVTVGTSFLADDELLLALDVSLREGVSYFDLEDNVHASKVVHRAVWNIQAGAEKTFTDWFKIRMGVYSSLSSHPDPDAGLKRFQEDRVDMLGYSANFVFVADQRISYTFGGYYVGGRGLSVQRIDQEFRQIPKTAHVFTMLVGTSFYF